MPALDPTAVDQDTDIMAVIEDPPHKALDLVPVSQICGINCRGSSEGTNLISCARIAFISLYQNYIGSSFGQRDRHRLADASRGAGDEGGLTIEVELVGEWHRER